MPPIRLVSMQGDNMAGINATLQMLKSVPQLDEMFRNRHFNVGRVGEMPLCDEIYELFETEDVTSAAYLRFLIKSSNSENFPKYGEKQDFLKIFRILFEAVLRELSCSSNKDSKNVWEKFRSRSSSVTCENCPRMEGPEILSVTPLEGCRTTVTRLINISKINSEKMKEKYCVSCQGSRGDKVGNLPSFLLVKVDSRPSPGCVVFPENKMRLVNGDTYLLTCIVDDDDIVAVVDDKTWVRCDATKHTPAARDDVKNVNNKIFLYVKTKVSPTRYKCEVAGCPLDKVLGSRKELERHMEKEHRRCSHCRKLFLLNCLYKEHLGEDGVCQTRGSGGYENVLNSPSGHSEESDAGSPSDSTEDPIKVIVKKTNSGLEVFEAKNMKRKEEVMEDDKTVKKSKTTNVKAVEDSTSKLVTECRNPACPHDGDDCYQNPPMERLGDHLKARGTILRHQSLAKGVHRFVPFNNTFLETLGCQFYFKNREGVIDISSYSVGGKEYEYHLTLSSKNTTKTSHVSASLGERRRVAVFGLDSSCLQYEIVINSHL